MINPSTADATENDHTIRKWLGFSFRLRFQTFIIGNLFAYRARDVDVLGRVADPVGPHNAQYLRDILACSQLTIVAWGAVGKLPPTLRAQWTGIVELADEYRFDLYCWGVGRDGHPRHPLMLPYDTPLMCWYSRSSGFVLGTPEELRGRVFPGVPILPRGASPKTPQRSPVRPPRA